MQSPLRPIVNFLTVSYLELNELDYAAARNNGDWKRICSFSDSRPSPVHTRKTDSIRIVASAFRGPDSSLRGDAKHQPLHLG